MNTCCLVKLHNLFNKRFQIKLVIVRGTDLGIETEIIDHLLHGRNLIDDRLCRALEDLLVTTLEFGADFHLDTLCGQLNRRQRILDFMGQTARYLAPRFGSLCGHKRGHIIKNNQISLSVTNRKACSSRKEILFRYRVLWTLILALKRDIVAFICLRHKFFDDLRGKPRNRLCKFRPQTISQRNT